MSSVRWRVLRAKIATQTADTLIAAASMFAATIIAFLLDSAAVKWPAAIGISALIAVIFAVMACTCFLVLRVHHQVWRHAGWRDAVQIARAGLLTLLIYFPVAVFVRGELEHPLSNVLIVIPVWFFGLFAIRMIALNRSIQAPFAIFRRVPRDARLVLLVGKIDEVASRLREPTTRGALRALGILTTDEEHAGRAVQSVPVMGTIRDLEDTIKLMRERYGRTPDVALVGDRTQFESSQRLLRIIADSGAKPLVLTGAADHTALRQINPSDLLRRRERLSATQRIEAMVAGQTVLVTGAGGSIGSALVRLCAASGAQEIILFENCEFNLYAIDLELSDSFPNIRRRAVIGDVRDDVRLDGVLAETRPGIVIHAAALKHVPLNEDNPCEAVLTNVFGALNTARRAQDHGVERFIFISTDKAASPTSVMGATKRLAEIALQSCLEPRGMALSIVRFGNVLGSSGSVMKRFEEQIERGGPVTVIHPNATRFFMTLEEAAQLVLSSATLVSPGDPFQVFMLDMGEPVKVLDLADMMIRLKGLRPQRDINIVFTGPRAGDRLHERLIRNGERQTPTGIEDVLFVNAEHPPRVDRDALKELHDIARDRDGARTTALLRRLIADDHDAEQMESAAQ